MPRLSYILFLGLLAWLIAGFQYFFDGFGPTAKWPWAHHVLPAALWCCLPTSHLPPHSHLQSAGVSDHPDWTTSLAPFYPAENSLQMDKATLLKLIDFSGITSGFTHITDRAGMCGEDHQCTSGELWGDVALLTLLYNLVPSTTPLTCTISAGDTSQDWRSSENGNTAMIQRCDCSSSRHAWVTFSCQLWCWQQASRHRLCKSAQDPGWALGCGCSSMSQLPCYLYPSQEISGELRMERQATVCPLNCRAAKA